jgi:glycosyltransferase involved in cell wall biosynthesis
MAVRTEEAPKEMAHTEMPLVSLCIPTYNGARTLGETLDSVVAQGFEGLEVVICDDASRDETVAIAEAYATRHAGVRVIYNDKNVGMDRNFARTALHATGTYIWFCGQDDIFLPGAFAKFQEIHARHPQVDVVYFNYRFLNGDLSREVAEPVVKLSHDGYFTSAKEYFGALDHAPTFLAATVMRRSLWDRTPYERFYDTHYVQMGVILHNLSHARVYVVADPRYVVCRVPEDSWKLRGGRMLFEIHSGSLEVYHTVFHTEENPVPAELFRQKMRHFIRSLPMYVVGFNEKGFRRTPLIETRMKRMFGARLLLYWLYVWPLLHLPAWLCALLLKAHRSSLTRWMTRGAGRLLIWLGNRGPA